MYLFNGDLGGLPLKRSDFVRGHDDRRFVRTTLNRSRIRKALNIRVIRRCSFVLRTRLYSDRAKLEDDGRDGFEVMDPFFTFGALAAEVEPLYRHLTHVKPRLARNCRLGPRSRYVGLVRNVIYPSDALHLRE